MDQRPLRELTEYRASEKLSRKQLGDKLGVSGVTVFRWERGDRKPDRQFAPALSELTGIPILTLMGMSE